MKVLGTQSNQLQVIFQLQQIVPGNNLEENEIIEPIDEGIDLNDNLEELVPGLEDNIPLENNNGAPAEELIEEIAEHAGAVEQENEASGLELEV